MVSNPALKVFSMLMDSIIVVKTNLSAQQNLWVAAGVAVPQVYDIVELARYCTF